MKLIRAHAAADVTSQTSAILIIFTTNAERKHPFTNGELLLFQLFVSQFAHQSVVCACFRKRHSRPSGRNPEIGCQPHEVNYVSFCIYFALLHFRMFSACRDFRLVYANRHDDELEGFVATRSACRSIKIGPGKRLLCQCQS